MIDPDHKPLYQLTVTLEQLGDLKSLLEAASAAEPDPDAEIFELLDQVRKTRIEAIKFYQRNQERAAEIMDLLAEKTGKGPHDD